MSVLQKRSGEKDAKGPSSPEKKVKKDFQKQYKTKHASSKDGKSGFKPHNKFKNDKKTGGGNPFQKTEKEPGKPLEKLNAMQRRTKKKELRLSRRTAKGQVAPSNDVKQLYEKLKCKTYKDVTKVELARNLYDLMKKEDIVKGIRAHDTARIIQCLLKHGSLDLREEITNELTPVLSEMAMSKYARFCIIRLVKYGSNKIKQKLFDTLLEDVVKLTLNSFSSGIVDALYLTFANKKQRALMRQAFYGDIFKKLKDESIEKITDTYKDAPHMKKAVLSTLKSHLQHAANKSIVENSILHFLLLEYITECDEKDRDDIVGLYGPLVASFVTSWEGCKAGILCFWHSATKERRAIVKSLKEHLEKLCCHEFGHAFVIAVVNTLDDTKATKKVLFDPIHPSLETLVSNSYGRKVIEWFVSPSDSHNFHPELITFLDDGLKYSKKDKEIRRKEILEQIEGPISEAIAKNPEFWLSNKHIGLTTVTILKKLSSDKLATASESLAKVICNPHWVIIDSENEENKDDKQMLGIEDAGLHIALKSVIKQDKERVAANESTFGQYIVNGLNKELIESWIKLNRACFILLNILENSPESVQKDMKVALKPFMSSFKKQKHVGAKLLVQKLEKLV